MIRKIIHIDEEKCNGCGLCAEACHEGAIDMVDGKAKLVRENFGNGFGDCLPNCPTGAISFEARTREIGAAGALAADAVGEMGAEVLSEVVAACRRLATWSQWALGVASACLARSPEMRTH